MAKKATSNGALSCEISPGELHDPGVTTAITVRRTVTRVCEVISDLNFSVPTKLPSPRVSQAGAGVLDLLTFTGGATVIVKKWTFMAVGLKCWLDCLGTLTDGSAYTFHLRVGKPITATEVKNGLSLTLPRAELEKFLNRSQLTIVFKIAVDAHDDDGAMIVFPALKLTLHKPYKDLTDFKDQTLGLWEKGSAASDARDISIQPLAEGPDGKPGYFLKNYTYTNSSAGPVIQRLFDDLDSGETYQFSLSVRRDTAHYNTPKLSLRKDSVAQTAVLELIDLAWHTLSFTFVAGSAPVLLDLCNAEPSGTGNDFFVARVLVESVQAAP